MVEKGNRGSVSKRAGEQIVTRKPKVVLTSSGSKTYSLRTYPGTDYILLDDLASMCALNHVEWLKKPSTQELITNFKSNHLGVEPMLGLANSKIQQCESNPKVSIDDLCSADYLLFVHPNLAVAFVQQLERDQAIIAKSMIRKAFPIAPNGAS